MVRSVGRKRQRAPTDYGSPGAHAAQKSKRQARFEQGAVQKVADAIGKSSWHVQNWGEKRLEMTLVHLKREYQDSDRRVHNIFVMQHNKTLRTVELVEGDFLHLFQGVEQFKDAGGVWADLEKMSAQPFYYSDNRTLLNLAESQRVINAEERLMYENIVGSSDYRTRTNHKLAEYFYFTDDELKQHVATDLSKKASERVIPKEHLERYRVSDPGSSFVRMVNELIAFDFMSQQEQLDYLLKNPYCTAGPKLLDDAVTRNWISSQQCIEAKAYIGKELPTQDVQRKHYINQLIVCGAQNTVTKSKALLSEHPSFPVPQPLLDRAVSEGVISDEDKQKYLAARAKTQFLRAKADTPAKEIEQLVKFRLVFIPNLQKNLDTLAPMDFVKYMSSIDVITIPQLREYRCAIQEGQSTAETRKMNLKMIVEGGVLSDEDVVTFLSESDPYLQAPSDRWVNVAQELGVLRTVEFDQLNRLRDKEKLSTDEKLKLNKLHDRIRWYFIDCPWMVHSPESYAKSSPALKKAHDYEIINQGQVQRIRRFSPSILKFVGKWLPLFLSQKRALLALEKDQVKFGHRGLLGLAEKQWQYLGKEDIFITDEEKDSYLDHAFKGYDKLDKEAQAIRDNVNGLILEILNPKLIDDQDTWTKKLERRQARKAMAVA